MKEGQTYKDLVKLPLKERWSARDFDLSIVFDKVDEENAFKNNLDWYHDMRGWEGYRAYLASENIVQSPNWRLTKPHKLNRLCQEQE